MKGIVCLTIFFRIYKQPVDYLFFPFKQSVAPIQSNEDKGSIPAATMSDPSILEVGTITVDHRKVVDVTVPQADDGFRNFYFEHVSGNVRELSNDLRPFVARYENEV